MPPASLAKMMTTEVAFELIDKGQLPLEQDVHGAARDLAKVARSAGRIDDVPVAQRAGQRRKPAQGHRHLVGQRRVGRARRMHRRHRAGLHRADERAGARLGVPTAISGPRTVGPTRALPMSPRAISRPSPGRRSRTISSSTRNSIRCPASPGARRWARGRTSPRPTATRSWAMSRAPTASRPAIPMRRAMASPARPSRTAAG